MSKRKAAGARKSKPRKTRLPKFPPDVRAWMESGRVDRVADYMNRGRHYAELSNEQLAEAWKEAQRALAAEPFSEQANAIHRDLSSELELRGKDPPIDEVWEAVQTYIRKVQEQTQRLQADPEAWKASNEAMQRDIDEFIARRDRSKH